MRISIPQLVLLTCVASAASRKASDPFVGKWRLNASKSTIVDAMKIAPAGANKYTFSFEGAQPETIVADGTSQPGLSGTTLSVTVEAPDRWTVVREKGGQKLITARWRLGTDGQTLTDAFTTYKPDGSPSTFEYHYVRVAGGPGIPGTWESTSQNPSTTFELEVRPYEADGLSFDYTTEGVTINVRFDGKDHPNPGPNSGPVWSGRRITGSTLELSDNAHGKPTNTRRFTLSADLKVLTLTVQPVGQTRPNVLVFDRE